MKMIIFNCPAYKGFTRDIPDWLDNTNCGHYAGQVPCQDCTDCVLKQIVELCKRDKNFCINCKSKADSNIDCIECIEGGRAQLAQDILQLLDIQEVK